MGSIIGRGMTHRPPVTESLIAPACNGGTHMQQETEYRARAAYCVRLSENAKNSAHRVALLQQAQTWLRMAADAEWTQLTVEHQDRMPFDPPQIVAGLSATCRSR